MARGRQQNQSDKKYWCKIFQTKQDLVGAICDEILLDKELEDEKFKIKITKHFYGGAMISERAAIKIMNKITVGNIIGKDVIEIAMLNGFITEENIIFIDGVPHAQFVKL